VIALLFGFAALIFAAIVATFLAIRLMLWIAVGLVVLTTRPLVGFVVGPRASAAVGK
jgi:hypothetical protein